MNTTISGTTMRYMLIVWDPRNLGKLHGIQVLVLFSFLRKKLHIVVVRDVCPSVRLLLGGRTLGGKTVVIFLQINLCARF